MKTAEEWQKKMCHANTVRAEWIKKIQLEAYKAGMTEAAEIAEYGHESFTGQHRDWFDCKKAILVARDAKTIP